ncbi:hypothetical protein QBC46DRAFT_402738 [Diplogelasinospora grovesii]|uniref:Uncharacterized protein n=1 Tax=Diplogelasinospora grovesii TaxID=303347 RepID=A0AAN6NJQ0_9PEZI|nr:hypothetical protein QBC46DRAFT_402738 [Diplogelasinospora grovesii]
MQLARAAGRLLRWHAFLARSSTAARASPRKSQDHTSTPISQDDAFKWITRRNVDNFAPIGSESLPPGSVTWQRTKAGLNLARFEFRVSDHSDYEDHKPLRAAFRDALPFLRRVPSSIFAEVPISQQNTGVTSSTAPSRKAKPRPACTYSALRSIISHVCLLQHKSIKDLYPKVSLRTQGNLVLGSVILVLPMSLERFVPPIGNWNLAKRVPSLSSDSHSTGRNLAERSESTVIRVRDCHEHPLGYGT